MEVSSRMSMAKFAQRHFLIFSPRNKFVLAASSLSNRTCFVLSLCQQKQRKETLFMMLRLRIYEMKLIPEHRVKLEIVIFNSFIAFEVERRKVDGKFTSRII